MASIVAHAALPLVALKAFPRPPGDAPLRRLAIVAAVCACVPDLDVVTYALELRPPDVLAHRGVSHSLLAAFVVAEIAALLFFRAARVGSRAWWSIVGFLFAATAAHGVLDAFTAGDAGVALFAPLTAARVHSPWALVPSCPNGVSEYVGFWGALTVANELLYVVLPVAIVVTLVRVRRAARTGRGSADLPTPRRALASAGLWLAVAVLLRATFPAYFSPTVARVVRPFGGEQAGNLADLPRDDLPDGRLVTRFDDLRARGLLERTLRPASEPWSSTFFPSWFGGEAGRWSEGTLRLGWRTITGFAPPGEREARGWLASATAGDDGARRRLFTLAPTEKLDIALDRFDFPATTQALALSHNRRPRPRYWSGRCNGVAAASLAVPEPFRVVDVIGKDGSRVRFHPNDVKALLAVAYYETNVYREIGGNCPAPAFDAGATCSMSPAVFLLALTNRIGLARRSFLVDALPTIAKQFYAVAEARVRVSSGPRPAAGSGEAVDPALAGSVAAFVDVAMDLTLASTTVPYARADVVDPSGSPPGSRYEKVGVVPSRVTWTARVALDDRGEVIGGRWIGDPADGPDEIVIVDGGPVIDEAGMIASANRIPWDVVRALAHASADPVPADVPVLDLRTGCSGACL